MRIGVFSAARAVCSSPSGAPATFAEYLGIGRADGERILGLGDLPQTPVPGEEYKLAPLQPATAKPACGQIEVLTSAVLLFESVTGYFYFSGP